ncbi:MAG: DUF4269 domain-containing protein, partial [Litorilinea sp.]
MDDWSNIAYLQRGGERWQDAYRALMESDIFMVLAAYDPILVGAYPLGLEVSQTLEIICAAPDLARFRHEMLAFYQDATDFELEPAVNLPSTDGTTDGTISGTAEATTDNEAIEAASFMQNAFTIRVQARALPVEDQPEYRALDVAARLLRMGSDDARRSVQNLVQSGLPLYTAFATYFQLDGDPQPALVAHYDASYSELEEIVIA